MPALFFLSWRALAFFSNRLVTSWISSQLDVLILFSATWSGAFVTSPRRRWFLPKPFLIVSPPPAAGFKITPQSFPRSKASLRCPYFLLSAKSLLFFYRVTWHFFEVRLVRNGEIAFPLPRFPFLFAAWADLEIGPEGKTIDVRFLRTP